MKRCAALVALSLLGSGALAQDAAASRTPPPIAVAVLHEPFARLAPRLSSLVLGPARAAVDARLAAAGRPGLGARLDALADALGDTTVALVRCDGVQPMPEFVLRIALRSPAASDRVEAFERDLRNDYQALGFTRAFRIEAGADRFRFHQLEGGPGGQQFDFYSTPHELVLGNSDSLICDLRNNGRLLAAEPATTVALGRLRIEVPVVALRTGLARLGDHAARPTLQLALDALGKGTATFEAEVDAIDRLATLLGR